MSFENRKWVIFNYSEASKIDFSQVCEYSINTVRKSIDGTQTFIKWDGDTIPSSVSGLGTYLGPYNHSEILEILATSEWTDEDPASNPDSPHIPDDEIE
tara:strand:+ start:1777 stop:2073 length:297 start_codon:yes stop_codon:yes gene_type:complete